MATFQIDVKEIKENYVECNVYLPNGYCIRAFISKADYEYQHSKGFFVRSGEEKDSSGIINTSKTYKIAEE